MGLPGGDACLSRDFISDQHDFHLHGLAFHSEQELKQDYKLAQRNMSFISTDKLPTIEEDLQTLVSQAAKASRLLINAHRPHST